MAAPPQPIGIAVGELNFAAGTSTVRGQATLFDGDPVRSEFLPTRLRLKDGSRYVLGIASEGTVYRDHLVLRSGSADLVSAGRPSRVLSSLASVTADTAGSAATVYANKDTVTVLVRKGEVKVARLGSARVTTLSAGKAVTLKSDGRKGLALDSDNAVDEVARVQGDQLAHLTEAAQDVNCLAPRANSLARSYGAFSAQLAATQAARSLMQTRMDSGMATALDVRQLNGLNTGMQALIRSSAAIAEDLGDVVLQHHPGPGDPASSHTIHSHTTPEHHGQHGHSAPPPHGHHAPWNPPDHTWPL